MLLRMMPWGGDSETAPNSMVNENQSFTEMETNSPREIGMFRIPQRITKARQGPATSSGRETSPAKWKPAPECATP